MKVRLRLDADCYSAFAIADAREAVFNWLFRNHHHGRLYIRLDDRNFKTDEESAEAETQQHDAMALMKWLGVGYDEGPGKDGEHGPYRLSERLDIYKKYVDQLLESGAAYYCYFTPAEIEDMYIQQRIHGQKPRYIPGWAKVDPKEIEERKEAGDWQSIRLKVPGHVVELHDVVRGNLVYNGPEHSDFVIMRRSGMPTRAFAGVVDDHLFEVTHVMFDEGKKSQNPFRAFIANALGFDLPDYVHLPVIMASDRTLLSSRHGLVDIEEFRAIGYMPDALTNYLVQHGWEPGESENLRTLGSLARHFHVDEIQKGHSVWDIDALNACNRMAIERIKDGALAERLAPYIEAEGYDIFARGKDWATLLVQAVRPRLVNLAQVVEAIPFYFATTVEPDSSTATLLKSSDALKILVAIEETVNEMDEVVRGNYRKVIDAARGAITSRGKALVLTRCLLTGREAGTEFSKLLPLLGKELILSRLDYVRRYIPKASR